MWIDKKNDDFFIQNQNKEEILNQENPLKNEKNISNEEKEEKFKQWLKNKKKQEKNKKQALKAKMENEMKQKEFLHNDGLSFEEWVEKGSERKKKETEEKRRKNNQKVKEEEEKLALKEQKKYLKKKEWLERLSKVKVNSGNPDQSNDRKIDSPLLLSYSTSKDMKKY